MGGSRVRLLEGGGRAQVMLGEREGQNGIDIQTWLAYFTKLIIRFAY